MKYYSKTSKRTNPFQSVYDSPNVTSIPRKILTFPAFVDIELTNHCNMNCRMCPRSKAQRKEGFMCNNLFTKVVKECKQYNTPIRLIGWGEPLLHPELIDYIKYVKQKENQLLHITTNGLLLKDKIVKEIIKQQVDSIIVSFQGTNKEGYQKMRRLDKYDTLKENIQYFVRLRGAQKKPFIQVTTTTTTETQKEKQQFVDEWLPLVDAVSVGTTNLVFTNKNIHLPRVPCTEVYHQMQVDWDGKVSPCCGDYDNYLTIGNAHWQALYDIWNTSSKLDCIRYLLKNKNHRMLTLCKDCYPTYTVID